MATLPPDVVDDAMTTLMGDDTLLLVLPRGLSARERAALLDNVSDVVCAVRRRGVPVELLRVDGHDLERYGVADSANVEALFVLYTGEPPELPG